MWSAAERAALIRVIEDLGARWDIEAWLGRSYGLRSADTEEGVEYTGPGVGGWIRVRYRDDAAHSVVVVDRPR